MSPRSLGVAGGVTACGWLLAAMPAHAACTEPTARIVAIDNSVQLKDASTSAFVPATLNAPVCQGDLIRVGVSSRATVVFLDGGLRMTVEQNTEWVVRPPRQSGRSIIGLIRGAILFLIRQPRSVDVETPFVNAAVEGTEFVVRVERDRTTVAVLQGSVQMANDAGRLALQSGQAGEAISGRAPQRINVRPDDAVQWALYYQPILPGDSLQRLAQVPAGNRDAQFYFRTASVLLGAGRVVEARENLANGRRLDPNDGTAEALEAIIAVAQNRHDDALKHGQQAVALSPRSTAARLALSYALQATFNLQAARDELRQVVPGDASQDRPEHALALARLAELWLSLGELDRALVTAKRAVAVSPDLARASTVLGFAALAQMDTRGAKAAFTEAIARASSDPLNHLGLGLARIREGDLHGGRGDLETAAALDVEDAVIRSYLGKAYFDERRDGLAAREFDAAQRLDPLDPTAFLYDAIRKQSVNRPVEALRDLEKSIELNDNRAVYRSRFLLDADLAARSASLGQIYRDLGFEQMAVVEGWKSLDADPGDYSGHRLLADTYSALPRHEVARVSELLQAQLFQPLNITPVAPSLAETDLFILERAGPSQPAFNEFNPLFNRNRLAVQLSGAVGQRSLLGDEATVSGVWDRVSFSVGQYHYDTDGFRVNNDQDRDIQNAFVQYRLSPSTSVQAEFRANNSVAGDLNLLFNLTDFSADERTTIDSTVWRIGVRHVFSPRNQIIGSVYWGSEDRDRSSSFEGGHLTNVSRTDSWTAEVRHLFRSRRFNVTSGLGRFQSDRDRDDQIVFELPFPPFSDTIHRVFNDRPEQTNLYSYASVDLPEHVTLTAGASADFYERKFFERNQLNPKLGVSWNPVPSTTLRAAAFRVLHRTLVASQTIEPTQVAGFNQFFADVEGEEATRYGLAIDQKIDDGLFGGLEYSWRNLRVPVDLIDELGNTIVERFDRSEQAGRAYGYWTPGNRLALTANYLFERFDRNSASSGSENILELRTHRVPLSVRYFDPDGLFAGVTATYVAQNGRFAGLDFEPSGEDRFWIVDAGFGYRLPKRYGRIVFEAKNLFDEEFSFQDTEPGNPSVKPGRLALVTFVLGM